MRVLKNYLYNAGYQLLAIIVPLITSPYISRVLHAKGVGINAYTNSIIQYFILFAQLGIVLYGSKKIASVRNNKVKLSKCFWEIQILKTGTTIIALLATFIFILIYPRYQYYMMLQAINVIAVIFDISWFFSGLEDFKKIVFRNTIIRILSVIFIFTLIKNSGQTWLYILVLALSSLIGNITLWPYLRHNLVKVKFTELHYFVHINPLLELFIPTLATTIYMQLNKTMLGSMSGAKYAGYYYNSDQLIRAVLTLATSLGTVMLPHVAAAYANGNKKKVKEFLYTSFDLISLICMPMFFGIAGLSLKLGPFFYGSGFEIVGVAMLIESPIVILIAWNNTTGNQYLVPTGKNKEFTRSVIYGALFNIIANLPMIYFFNIYGAMIVTVLSEGIVTIYQLVAIRKEISLRRLFENTNKYFLASLIMFLPVFCMNLLLPSTIYSFIIEGITGILIYLCMILLLKPSSITFVKQFLKMKGN